MGSVGFEAEDESQPRTSNGKKCKLSRTVPENGGAVNHASVPRKLRSGKISSRVREKEKEKDCLEPTDSIKFCNATKKRGRRSPAPHLPILRKQCRVSNGIEKVRKDGGKKSKPNVKQGHITKDEEEVAETLFALAGMFSDVNNAKQPGFNGEPPEMKSSAMLEAGCLMNKIEGEEQQPELAAATKQPNTSSTSGNQFDSEDPRQAVSSLHMIPSDDEQAVAIEQVTACRIEYDMNSPPMDDKDGLFLSTTSLTSIAQCSEMQVSCLRMPESTHSAARPLSIENKVTAEKRSRKRCLAHVYISRLIKDLKVSVGKERSLEKPTRMAVYGANTHNQITGTSGTNGYVPFNGPTHFSVENESAKAENGILPHKRTVQDQQLASETSASCSSTYQGYNFLSLGTGVGGLDHIDGIDRARIDTSNQFHTPYIQSQGRTAILFSPSQNGHSAAFHGHNSNLAAQQVQLPQYPASMVNSSFTSARLAQQPVSQQQKWAADLAAQYNASGGRVSRSVLNYGHAVFPHLQAALGYHQPLSLGQQMQQQLMMGLNPTALPLPNAMRNHHHLPLGLERNGTAFNPESTPQHLQLPCNQHHSN